MRTLAVAAAMLIAPWTLTLTRAQSLDLRATIPFDFQVGKTEMPAGEYRIYRPAPGTIVLRATNGHSAVMTANTVSEQRGRALTNGELSFNRYGGTYFLAELWPPFSQSGVGLIKSPREKELARDLGVAQRAGIALQRK